MKKLAMEYVRARLIHAMLKMKEREHEGGDATLVLCQSKANNPSRHATIVANQAILRVFVVRQRTWSEIILTTTKRLMITHSQHNMKHIWR